MFLLVGASDSAFETHEPTESRGYASLRFAPHHYSDFRKNRQLLNISVPHLKYLLCLHGSEDQRSCGLQSPLSGGCGSEVNPMEGHKGHFLHNCLLSIQGPRRVEVGAEQGFEYQNWKIPTVLMRTGNYDVMVAVTEAASASPSSVDWRSPS